MLSFFKEYFTFTRDQRNGIIVLLIIIALLMATPYVLPLFVKQSEVDISQFKKEIEEFEKRKSKSPERADAHDISASTLFYFDPNEISEEGWLQLGVREKIVRIILNYRAKGGKFDEKEDLKKIYGFDEQTYLRLEPYILIPEKDPEEVERETTDPFDKTVYSAKKPRFEKEFERRSTPYIPKEPEPIVVELNSADSMTLTKVRGIGPVLSKRIIKYRDRLGGFVNVNQLREVYGIDTTFLDQIISSTYVNLALIKKLNVNQASYDEIAAHPYFGKNLAKAITNYRAQHGMFKVEDDLRKIYLIDENVFVKIEPYLSF